MLKSLPKLLFYNCPGPKPFFFSTAKGARGGVKDYSKLNHYQILNVSPNATQKQIKQSYYELAKKFHPDTYKGTDHEYFKHVQTAYQLLKNPEKRREYDMKNNLGFQHASYEDAGGNDAEKKSEKNKKGQFDDIKIDENMNFDEEYEKFMGKPIENHPEEVVVNEHPFVKQLNKEERIRYEYSFMRNNTEIHVLKYLHQKGYDETLNETIQLANERVQTSDEVKKRADEKFEKDTNWKITMIQIAAVVILVPTIMIAFHKRMKAKKEMMHDMMKAVKQEEEFEIRRVQDSFVFEGDKK